MANNRKSKKKNRKIHPYLLIAAALLLIAAILIAVVIALCVSGSGDDTPAGSGDVLSSASEAFAESEGSGREISEESPGSVSEAGGEESGGELSETSKEPESSKEPEESREPSGEFHYLIDMSEYERYVEPKDPLEYVFLVNPSHKLSADDVPADLVDCIHTRKDGRDTQKLRLCAEKALEAFLAEGKASGEVTNVTVTSAYRSYQYQDYLFNLYCEQHQSKFATREECEAYVLTFSTKPGTSEHQSGLCCDMHNLGSAEQSFAKTKEAKWLAENCWRFGFILRYPADKEDITKIIYEPWHFRFVGRKAAVEMHELGMCLEEYCAYKGID